MSKALEFENRATHENVEKESVWRETAFYEVESSCISKWCEWQAKRNMKKFGVEKAKEKVNDIKQKIEMHYCPDIDPEQRIIDKARKGFLEIESPASTMIYGMWFLLIVAIMCESVVFLVQAIASRDINPIIFLWAVILAIGGVLLGMGIGGAFLNMWYEETGRKGKAERGRGRNIWTGSIGSILIIFVGIVRSFGASEVFEWFTIFGLTLLLGLVVATAEGLRSFFSGKRFACLQEMALAQFWIASDSHMEGLGKYCERYIAELGESEIKGDLVKDQEESETYKDSEFDDSVQKGE